jgi:hypothetical protein
MTNNKVTIAIGALRLIKLRPALLSNAAQNVVLLKALATPVN